MRIRQLSFFLSALAVLLLISVQPPRPSQGRLVVRVIPGQAYIFADGNPVVDVDHHYLVLSPGEHKIDLYNYGYKPNLAR